MYMFFPAVEYQQVLDRIVSGCILILKDANAK